MFPNIDAISQPYCGNNLYLFVGKYASRSVPAASHLAGTIARDLLAGRCVKTPGSRLSRWLSG